MNRWLTILLLLALPGGQPALIAGQTLDYGKQGPSQVESQDYQRVGQPQPSADEESGEDESIGLSPPPCPWIVVQRASTTVNGVSGSLRTGSTFVCDLDACEIWRIRSSVLPGPEFAETTHSIRLLATDLRPQAPPFFSN
ncbi:MAG: hypothetical protein ACPGXK_07935 [Phycisphaerae bacterium]